MIQLKNSFIKINYQRDKKNLLLIPILFYILHILIRGDQAIS